MAFPLGVYWPWEFTARCAAQCGLDKWPFVDRCLDRLLADGYDAVWATNLGIADLPGLADRMARRGMSLVPALSELHYAVPWRQNNWLYLETQSRLAIEAAGDSPAVLAWALCDEPGPVLAAELEIFRTSFAQWGAKQPAVVVTTWAQTTTYAQACGFGAVCTAVYPYFSAGNPNGPNTPAGSQSWYRRHADITAQQAAAGSRPAWLVPQGCLEVWGPWRYDDLGDVQMLPGAILHRRRPTVGEARWEVWSAIAAGVQGLWVYHYLPPPCRPDAVPYVGPVFPPEMAVNKTKSLRAPPGLVRPNGGGTAEYWAIGQAYREVRGLAPLLRGLVPCALTAAVTAGPGYLAGLADPAGDRTVGVLVNDDTDRAQTIRIQPGKPYQVRDLRSGRILDRSRDGTVSIRLSAGDGTVLQLVG